MHWIVLSDVHERVALLERLAPELRSARGVVLSGDLTMFGGRAEAEAVVASVRRYTDTILAVPGNTDHLDALSWMEAEGLSLHGAARRFDDVAFYGVGGSNPTPFRTPFELEEGEIAELLERAHAAAVATGAPRRVLVSHPPPAESGVDRLWSGGSVGSTAVRAHVEATRPALVLCGHIHEARGHGSVAGVPVLNPGPFGAGGHTRIDVDETGLEGRVHVLERGAAERVGESVGALAHKISRIPRKRPSREAS